MRMLEAALRMQRLQRRDGPRAPCSALAGPAPSATCAGGMRGRKKVEEALEALAREGGPAAARSLGAAVGQLALGALALKEARAPPSLPQIHCSAPSFPAIRRGCVLSLRGGLQSGVFHCIPGNYGVWLLNVWHHPSEAGSPQHTLAAHCCREALPLSHTRIFIIW